MHIGDLDKIKRGILSDIVEQDKRGHDDYREGVGAGLTMALMRIERMIEEEDKETSRYYDEE